MEDASHPRAKKITAMEARHAFGRILEEVYYKGEAYIIERAGKPMAAVIPLSQLAALQKNSDPAKIGHDPGKAHTHQSKKRRS